MHQHPSCPSNLHLRGVALLAAIAAWQFTAACLAATVAIVGEAPPQFVEAAKKAGYEVVAARDGWPASADVALLVASSPAEPAQRRGFDAAATALLKDAAGRLGQGRGLIVSFGNRPELLNGYDELLPVNLWCVTGETAGHGDLVRRGCGAIIPAGSPWAGTTIADAMRLSARYDLHLPFAAIEAGEHRYRFSDRAAKTSDGTSLHNYDKSLLNTDWQVLLNADSEGRLPLLIAGRYGPGRVVVFGGSLFDDTPLRWPGYGKLIVAALSAAAPPAPPLAASQINHADTPVESSRDLTLHIPRYQPDSTDTLSAEISNSGQADATAVLSYKISTAGRALLNSQTEAVVVPKGKTIRVPMRQRSRELDQSGNPAPRETFLLVRATLLNSARTALTSESEAVVDTAPAVTLQIRGEDVRGCDDMKSWPDRAMGKGTDVAGGAPIDRYVYSTGQSPRLTVVVRNGLHDLSPLATARDLEHPDNPTVQGLNDLAFSAGSIRGLLPSFGSWYGQSATEQRVALRWDEPVLLAASTIYGHTAYRNWSRCNPSSFELAVTGAVGRKIVADVKDATYVLAAHRDDFAAAEATGCELHVTGLDPSAVYEPGSRGGVGKSNCAIQEWETLGWPGVKPPPRTQGQLLATCCDMVSGKTEVLLNESVAVEPLAELTRTLIVPAKADFGPARIDVTYSAPNGVIARSSFDVLSIPPGRKAIEPAPKDDFGLLCSPGFITFDPFGLGTDADTQGWGGPDDKVWAFTHDFMEEGYNRNNPRASMDQPRKMMVSSTRLTHYTDPWRDFPSGEHFWDYAGDKLEAMLTHGLLKGHSTVHLMLSDRWNGINVGDSFSWADFIRFDEYLRKTTGRGLAGRTRLQIGKEIVESYGDVYQKFQMDRYADKLLAVRDRLAAKGADFTVTTHGSFPLVGGELGEKIGKTHKAVGTDLFWELKREDLYYSIGHRFGLIAANPDFESGAYNEFGWCSATMNNPHWFACGGAVEPSRRQWYSTYFAGRVTSQGAFEPLTKFGFGSQGDFGPKQFDNDWQAYYRVQHLATKLRPEAPAGFGLVVSWPEQERHMGKKAGAMGFGLYAGEGFDNIDAMAGDLYERLVKEGVPISFVASTHTLGKWSGKGALIVVDGYCLTEAELSDLDRLNAAGTPIIAVGGGAEAAENARADQLLGVARRNGSWLPAQGTQSANLGYEPIAFTTLRPGRGATLFCPYVGKDLTSAQSSALAQAISKITGNPLKLSPGLAVTSFVSNGNLFLAIGDQGDVSRAVTVSVCPARLAPDWPPRGAAKWKVIDLNTSMELPASVSGDEVTFTFPMAASDGHMIMICGS